LGGVLGQWPDRDRARSVWDRRFDLGQDHLNGKSVRFRREIDAIRAGLALVPENRKFDGLFFNFRASGNITAAALVACRASAS
jgi:ribose transport system ATP-binding protein